MIICQCYRVSDREIRLAIELGARDVEAVSDTCGAGMGCTGCHNLIAQLIAEKIPNVEMAKPRTRSARV